MNSYKIPSESKSHPNYSYEKHLKNVMACFNENVHEIAATFHDVGKLSIEFQKFITDIEEKRKPTKTTHSLESAIFFLHSKKYHMNWENFSIFFSILMHHRDLPDVDEYSNDNLSDIDFLRKKYPGLEKRIEYLLETTKSENTFCLDTFTEIFDYDDFVKHYDFAKLENYFKFKEIFSKLCFADKYEAIFKNEFQNKFEQKQNNFNNAEFFIEKLKNELNNKSGKLSKLRNQARLEVIENYHENMQNRIFLIEAPTGIGKTFTALNLALEIIKDNPGKKRLITALPMTSIIDQTYEEYNKIFDSNDVLKHHYLSQIKSYNNNTEDENREFNKDYFLSNSWAYDKVIITTFNQLFNSFYSNKNRDIIKYWTLRDSVVVIDEIQSVPRVLYKDIAKTITYLSQAMNIHFIIMSATIPEIKKYFKTSCSLLSENYFSMDFNYKYDLEFNNKISNIKELAENIIESLAENQSILCVVNTKKISQSLYNYILDKVDANIFLLNGFFIPLHRKRIIAKIKDLLEKQIKGNKAVKKIILISTQVIEAGVDLDFDICFREFAPFSSIIQTAGRVNREGRKSKGLVIVFPCIGNHPYHEKDMSEKVVRDILKNKMKSHEILNSLREYFVAVIKKTSPDFLLLANMENLDFEQVYKRFSDNFMKKYPGLIPVFIEIERGILKKIRTKYLNLISISEENKDNLEITLKVKAQFKELMKKIAMYIVQVPENSAIAIKECKIWENSEIVVLDFDAYKTGSKYSEVTGWVIEEEMFI